MKNHDATGALGAALASCRQHFVAAAGFSGLVNLLYIAPTLYMLQVYDRVVPTQGRQTLMFLTVVLLFSLATLSLLDRVRARLLTRAGVMLDGVLAPSLLDTTLGRPELVASRRALREFDVLRATLTGPGILALFDAPWTPIYVIACFIVHPLIGAVALTGGVVLPMIAWLNERATADRLSQAQNIATSSYASQDCYLGQAEAVRALGMRRAVVSRQLRERSAMLTAQTEASFAASGYLTMTKFVRLALQSLALGLGALLAIDNQISGGAIFAASFLIARALAPVEALIGAWKGLAAAFISYRSIESLLGGAHRAAAHTQLPPPSGALLIEDVTIVNEARDGAIVFGASFALAAGEVLAIVGPSGAGKSTLLRAIAGALAVDRGAVRLDGANMQDWDPERLARHIGYLPQETALFAGTVKENIARFRNETEGDSAAIDAAVVNAARKVGAEDLILGLSGGYDHLLQLGGRGLSAGQAQRIALARAAFGDPALLLLDEPNAHLDSDGDIRLTNAIAAMKREGQTVIIISHKLSILPVVDKLLVLKGGRIDMFGRRDEILPKIAPPNVHRMPQATPA